jgi:hypothetical protein
MPLAAADNDVDPLLHAAVNRQDVIDPQDVIGGRYRM